MLFVGYDGSIFIWDIIKGIKMKYYFNMVSEVRCIFMYVCICFQYLDYEVSGKLICMFCGSLYFQKLGNLKFNKYLIDIYT